MKRIKKKLLPLVLALAMCLGMCHIHSITVQAAESVVWLIPPGAFALDVYNGFSDGLMLAQDWNTAKYGYVNTVGQLVIPCLYEQANSFSGGAAKVYLGDIDGQRVYGFINTAGQMLCRYTEQQDVYPKKGFSEGYLLAYSKVTRKYGFMDSVGQLVVACQYEEVKDFSDGLAAVYDSGSRYWGYVDAAGNVVIPCQYKEAYSFSGGYARVKVADRTDRWMLIDKSGRNVIPEGYIYDGSNGNTFSDNSGVVALRKTEDSSGEYYLLDISGGIVGPVNVYSFHDGFAWNDGKLFDTAGRQVFATDGYSSVWHLGDGYFSAYSQAGEIIIDRDGNPTMPSTFPSDVYLFGDCSEGFAAMSSEATGLKRYGFVNMAGQAVVPAKYAEARSFCGGVAQVRNFDFRWGLVDSTGAEVLPLQYGYMEQAQGATGIFRVIDDHNRTGLVAAPTVYAANGAIVNYAAQAEVNDALNAGLVVNEALGGDYRAEITREQLAATAVKLYEAASGQPAPAVGATPFIDVDNVAVTQAKTLELIDGLPDGQFVPKATVPREQAAAILSGVSAKLNGTAPAEQAAKFEPEGSTRKTASIEETLATAARILKKIKK